MRHALVAALVAGCTSSSSPPPIAGPFTGEIHRFAIDAFELPPTSTRSRELGDDLNGDRVVDNQLGQLTALLAGEADLSTHGADMIAAGVIASTVEIQADDLTDDPTVGVRVIGADGEAAEAMGGTFVAGKLTSNRLRDGHATGTATLHLPAFADADPSMLAALGLQIDLAPDGAGGYNAIVSGAVSLTEIDAALLRGVRQMFAAAPGDHVGLAGLYDLPPFDGVITDDEIVSSTLTSSVLAPDIMYDDHLALSLGFGVHLTPCPTGHCTKPIVDPCHDRLRDGDETDVDCGGSCGACGADATCALAADCLTQACNAGHCAAPTCDDGIRDGFETGRDCGWWPGCRCN